MARYDAKERAPNRAATKGSGIHEPRCSSEVVTAQVGRYTSVESPASLTLPISVDF